MKISTVFKTCDPFSHLMYPQGATGLTLRIAEYWFAKDRVGHYYVLRDVIESMDYTNSSGEAMCGVTPVFTDTYWRVGSRAEARMLWMRLITDKAHYEHNYTIINR